MSKIKITEDQAKALMSEMLKISDSDVDGKSSTANPMDTIKKVAQKASASPDLNNAINKGDVAMSAKTADGFDVAAKKSSTNENVITFKQLNEMRTKNLKKGSKVVSLNEFFLGSKKRLNEVAGNQMADGDEKSKLAQLKLRIEVAYQFLEEYVGEDKVRCYDLTPVLNNLQGAMKLIFSMAL